MPRLDFRRRPLSSDHGGRVYFCAHPADVAFRESLIEDVLALADCIACFDAAPEEEGCAEWDASLAGMQLFAVVVSRRFLAEPKTAELALARAHRIPILPILAEGVGLEDYDRLFPHVQYLDPKDNSDAALPYTQKLERALGEVLQSTKARAKIRESFDGTVFLSYRKKDRRSAQALLEKIHNREDLRSVAIWYDEFLLPGEDFNHSIDEAMVNSELFLLSVTPNVLEPTNYVMDVEFPAALAKNMPILSVETQSTDLDDFSHKFEKALPLVSFADENRLFSALDRVKQRISPRESTPERTYYLGLAYLGGISVEVNRPLGVELIRRAAKEGFAPAVKKLIGMYRCGEGVERNYAEALALQKRQIDALFSAFEKARSADAFRDYLCALLDLAEDYRNLGDYDAARVTLNKTRVEADRLRNTRALSITGQFYMRLSTLRLATVERLAGNGDEAIHILKSNLPYYRFELEQSDSDEDRRGLAVLLMELAALYAEKGNAAKSEKFSAEAMALNEALASKEGSSAIDRYNLAVGMFNGAIALSKQGDHVAALKGALDGMEVASSAAAHHEASALYVRFHLLLGEEYVALNNTAEARMAFATAVDLCDSPLMPKDVVALKLKAEAMRKLGDVALSEGNAIRARQHLRGADKIYEELIAQYGDKSHYKHRAAIAFADGQICNMMCLMQGARYNYEKCLEYLGASTEEPGESELHLEALTSYLLATSHGDTPDVPLLQKAFTVWNGLASREGGEQYARYRDQVAAILVRHMF